MPEENAQQKLYTATYIIYVATLIIINATMIGLLTFGHFCANF